MFFSVASSLQRFAVAACAGLVVTGFLLVIAASAQAQEEFGFGMQTEPKPPVGPSATDRWHAPFPEPGPLTPADLARYQFATFMGDGTGVGKTSKLERCEKYHSPKFLASTEVRISERDADICAGRQKEVVWLASTQGLYVCQEGKIVDAMRTSIGKAGLGKDREGDNKTPVGRYWLGVPRASKNFGLFIHVGYPNEPDLAMKRTGTDIGIHSTRRYLFYNACHGYKYVGVNWTQGCIAVARDEQIKKLADWVIEHWPVQIELINDQ